jgi:hypothetical protein
MPKPRKTVRVRLPSYVAPRLEWRKRLLGVVRTARGERGIRYETHDRLALDIRLYLAGHLLEVCDVDNRLKDVMDALQGQIGGHGKKLPRPHNPIVRNDCQIWRVAIEKVPRPSKLGAQAGGFLRITRLRTRR